MTSSNKELFEEGMKRDVIVIKSKRKSISVEVNSRAEVIVRAPRWMPNYKIAEFVEKHRDFIGKSVAKMERRKEALAKIPRISDAERKGLALQAAEVIPQRVRFYAQMIGVTYNKITIRNQRTRWGSCSVKGNLNFNLALMRVPPQALDYVVVHELCHRLEMNHSDRFWREVEKAFPEYKTWRKWLRDNGSRIMAEVSQAARQ